MLRAFGSSLLLSLPLFAQSNFPPPPAPANNPVTQDKVLLGMALFFEEQMSTTGTVACATCHDMTAGGIDPRTSVSNGPDGIYGTGDDIHSSPGVAVLLPTGQPFGHPEWGFGPQHTPRRTPTVINSGYHTHLGFDGSKPTLEDLIRVPPTNPVEMGHLGRTWTDVEQDIAAAAPLRLATNLPVRLANFIAGRTYPDLFQVAFGSPQVTEDAIVMAIASYLRTLNSDESRWDKHRANPAQFPLTTEEQLGLTLFEQDANGATSCHTCHGDFEARVQNEGPIAGQMTMTNSGPYGSLFPVRLLFHNVGLRPVAEDPGRQNETGLAVDGGKFRVASLRNVELSGPYFHNGGARTLEDVVEFYNRGGDFTGNQAHNLLPRNYTQTEVDAIVALLEMLTDPRVAAGTAPFDQPTLGSQNGRLVTSVGGGTRTASGLLTANAPIAPRLGDSRFRITLSGVTPGVFSFLMWDLALAQTPQPYGIELGLTSSFLASGMGPASWMLTMPNTGVVDANLPLPNDPGLAGVTFFGQWLVLEPTGAEPVATSNAFRIEVH